MLPRTSLIRIQRDLYQKMQSAQEDLLGDLSPQLQRYYREYQKDFRAYQQLSTPRELLLATLRSHLVLIGDYHTLAQAQRTVIRLLREGVRILQRRDRPAILALEMLRPKDNETVEMYLSGRISEKTFLKKIAFHETWGFHWPHYRELFAFCRQYKVKIVGINLKAKRRVPLLKERDLFAAEVLADITASNPRALVFVLVGDLHLGSQHLPKLLSRELKSRKLERKTLVIHQNNDQFYWKLVDSGLEQFVDVVRIKKDVYCVLNTPPWIKLQNHAKWTESQTQMSFRSEKQNEEILFSEIDLTDDIFDLIQMLRRILHLPAKSVDSGFQDYEVHGPTLGSLKRTLIASGSYTKNEVAFLEDLLKMEGCLYLASGNYFILSSLNLNHCSLLAAKYLHHKISGQEERFWSPTRDFYRLVWVECLGYLGSKLINPKRKCDGPRDYRTLVRMRDPRTKAARFLLKHLESECGKFSPKQSLTDMQKLSRLDAWIAAKGLGEILGEGFYQGLVEGRVNRQQVRRLFYINFDSAELAFKWYRLWAQILDEHGLRFFSKRDRL
jgi:hypothetical protein